jgi:hypothetical protein
MSVVALLPNMLGNSVIDSVEAVHRRVDSSRSGMVCEK